MITQMKWGAMYAQLDEGDILVPDPVQLGDHLLVPGDRVIRIGSKKRTQFEMKDGFYLVYQGTVDQHLLFTSEPTGCDGQPWYYSFIYVDPLTLLSGSHKGCRDIRVDELVLFEGTETG